MTKAPINGYKLFQRHRRQYAHGRIKEWVEKREQMAAHMGFPSVSITGTEWVQRTTRELGKDCDDVLLSMPEQFCDQYPRVMLIEALVRDLKLELKVVVVLHYLRDMSLAKIDAAIDVEPKRSMHWLWDAQEQIANALEDLQNAEKDMKPEALRKIRERLMEQAKAAAR